MLVLVCLANRLIDEDEGYYLMASRLVLEQRTPYLDFFYTQAPLLPYAYGLWMKLFGISWFSARDFSAALTTVLGVFIYTHVCFECKSRRGGLAAVILFSSSTLIFAWFPIAKTYSLATIFLFGAYMIVSRVAVTTPMWLLVTAGVLFGLSVDTRLYVVGLAPLFFWWVYNYSEKQNRIYRSLWFIGGLAIGIAPCLILFLSAPDVFFFNNLGFHAIRSNLSLDLLRIGGIRYL